MSNRAVLGWLVVAVLLGAATLIAILRPRQAPFGVIQMGARVVEVDPASIRSLTVTHPDGRIETVRRAEKGDGGEWEIALTRSGVETPVVWPVIPERVRSMVRLLSEMKAVSESQGDNDVGPDALSMLLTMDDGDTCQLRFATRTVAGQGLVEVKAGGSGAGQGAEAPRFAVVDDSVLRVLRNPGPRGWRDSAVLQGVGPDVSRITLQNPQRTITLARSGGRWHVRQPVAAPADAEAVRKTIEILQGLTVADFLDERPPAAANAGLEQPVAMVIVETDRRAAGGADDPAKVQVDVDRRTVALGGPADSSGRRLYAAMGEGPGRRVVAVDAAALTQLAGDPTKFIAAPATGADPKDVGMLMFSRAGGTSTSGTGGRSVKRSLSSWAEMLPSGKEAMLSESEAGGVNELLNFVCAGKATGVSTSPPEMLEQTGQITLLSLDAAPLETIGVGAAPGTIVLKSGDVYRVYPGEAAPKMLRDWMASLGARVGPAVNPAGQPGQVEPTK